MAEHYRQQIRDGVLKPGDKFPSIRDIAEKWETTPTTVHRSIRMLSEEGWIEVSPRRVPTVRGAPPS